MPAKSRKQSSKTKKSSIKQLNSYRKQTTHPIPIKTTLSDVYSTVLDNIKPNLLSTTVNRLNKTSKYYRDIDIGDENTARLLLFDSTHFAYKDEYILENKEFNNEIDSITYMGIPITNIVKLILKNDFLFIFDDDKGERFTTIAFEKNIFYFDAILPFNTKYTTANDSVHNWYARCECSLYFIKNRPIFHILSSNPQLEENETLDDFMSDINKRLENESQEEELQPIYEQNIPIQEMNLLWKDTKIKTIDNLKINKFVIKNVTENIGYIDISYNYDEDDEDDNDEDSD